MIAPARVAALQALLAVAAGGQDLASALEQSRTRLSDPRDRALATDIVTGVERWRATLDHLITTFARRRLDRLDAEVVAVLRLSAYQLLHLTRVPAAAVVDDAVNLAGKAGKKSARGFVNAVLRAIARSRHQLPLPPRPVNPEADREATLAYLSVTLSHPRWLVARWLTRYGFAATEQWLQFNNAAPPLSLRVNRLRTTRDHLEQELREIGVDATRGRYAPHCLIIQRGDRLQRGDRAPRADRDQADDLETLNASFVVQDESSQLVTLLAGAHPGHRVLDTCASPGGKTTALAADLSASDRIVACDVRDRRVQLLRRTLSLAGAQRVHVVQADLLSPLPFTPVFDCVFVDAPCSGLGTLRRDPDIKWRRDEAHLAALAAAQRTMLTNAAALVVPGGRLIYATCSSEPEENDAVAEAFAQSSAFERVDARTVHPQLPAAVVDATGALRTTPSEHGLEAFFGVVFRRPGRGAAVPATSGNL